LRSNAFAYLRSAGMHASMLARVPGTATQARGLGWGPLAEVPSPGISEQ
jgi:hypothetical protein